MGTAAPAELFREAMGLVRVSTPGRATVAISMRCDRGFVGFVGYPEHYPGDGLGTVAGDGTGAYPLGVLSCLGQQTTRIFGPHPVMKLQLPRGSAFWSHRSKRFTARRVP